MAYNQVSIKYEENKQFQTRSLNISISHTSKEVVQLLATELTKLSKRASNKSKDSKENADYSDLVKKISSILTNKIKE